MTNFSFIHQPASDLKYFIAIIALLLLGSPLISQTRFSPELLNNPKLNGPEIDKKLGVKEIHEYKKTSENCVHLENGFRLSRFVNERNWLAIKDTVRVTRVDIVFSKYPIRNGAYNEIYPLLFNRIKATISMDPSLNSDTIPWNKVWQTHCVDNAQVSTLFHGVVIWYETKTPKRINADIKEDDDPVVDINSEKETEKEIEIEIEKEPAKIIEPAESTVNFILDSPHLPDSVKTRIKNQPPDARGRLIKEYFDKTEGTDKKGIEDPLTRLHYLSEIENFMRHFPESDPIVGKVLDRHPEWTSKIVINDWTGSMYGYGAQVLTWHLMNLDSSGISTITLFNDGDGKSTSSKKIGKTGGIYTEKAENAQELINLFNTVMARGSGGDGPENDIEAILEAIEGQPLESEVILIADNRACVRDIELAKRIQRPVRIVLCGYSENVGINPHYVYLAKITGGGIYTIEHDIEDVKSEIDENGRIISFDDERLELASAQCTDGSFLNADFYRFNLKTSRFKKHRVKFLDASRVGITELPSYVFKMTGMLRLNASSNLISSLPTEISIFKNLAFFDISHNRLNDLPESFSDLKYLEHLNLAFNDFTEVPDEIVDMKFLININLSNNQISEFKKLDSRFIETLDLSNNRIKELPSMNRYSKLYGLNISGNQFTTVPENIPLHKSLRLLDLSNNQLTHMPDDLSAFKSLRVLNLAGNNFSEFEKERIRTALFTVDLRF